MGITEITTTTETRMPVLWLPEAEWKALHALFSGAEEIDWDAY